MGRFRVVSLLSMCLILTGCFRAEITGVVTNHLGETLPGVSVHVEDTQLHALTNIQGEYRIPADPGEYTLLFAKTGYTIFDQVVRVTQGATTEAPKATLWNLPAENNVFLYENLEYSPTTWAIPSRYYMADGTTDYGTQRDAEVYSDVAQPLIICYRTPRYDARLTRLQQKEAKLPQDDSQTFTIWGAAGSVGVDLEPVVHSDPSLLKLVILEPLQPGYYAVHWGAMEGYSTLDKRIFIFEITEKALPDFEVVDPEMDGKEIDDSHKEGDAP